MINSDDLLKRAKEYLSKVDPDAFVALLEAECGLIVDDCSYDCFFEKSVSVKVSGGELSNSFRNEIIYSSCDCASINYIMPNVA